MSNQINTRTEAIKFMGLENVENLDEKTVKKAYHKLALEYHPDKQSGSLEKFDTLSRAYNTLQMTTSTRNGNRRPIYMLYLDMRDMIGGTVLNGCRLKCMNCSGDGYCPDEECVACKGKGSHERTDVRTGIITPVTCAVCKGSGVIRDKCPHCNGGFLAINDTIHIPSNSYPGKTIERNGLMIKLGINENKQFRTRKLDIITYKKVKVSTLCLGGEVDVDIPSGGKEKIAIQEGTQANQNIVIEGKGWSNGNQKGNLIVIITPIIPKKIGGLSKFILKNFMSKSL